MNEEKFYSEQEADAILSEAARIAGVAHSQQTRQHLVSVAAELGISEKAVLEAERRIMESRQLEIDKAEFLKQRNAKLLESIWSYLGTSLLMVGIDFMASGYRYNFPGTWSVWVVGIWGLVLGSEVLQTLNQGRQSLAFERWRKRKQRRKNKQVEKPDVNALLDDHFEFHPYEDKLEAIKMIRDYTGAGLAEAKQAVDEYLATRGLA